MKAALRRLLTALHLAWLYTLWHRLRRWDPRTLRRAALFRRWNEGAEEGQIVLRPGLRLAIDPRSREPFEHFCFRSPEMVEELDAFLREMPSCRRFLDVGACHGVFALAFAQGRPEAQALALDPSPVACEVLAANVAKNHLANVLPRQAAAGATPGRVRMRQVWHHLEADPEGPIEVPIEPVDDLCAGLGFEPDLLKVDVEGYELAVLTGAKKVLARYRPKLFLELHPERLQELGGSVAEVVALLAGLGYGFRTLRGAPLSAQAVARRQSVSRIVCQPG